MRGDSNLTNHTMPAIMRDANPYGWPSRLYHWYSNWGRGSTPRPEGEVSGPSCAPGP